MQLDEWQQGQSYTEHTIKGMLQLNMGGKISPLFLEEVINNYGSKIR